MEDKKEIELLKGIGCSDRLIGHILAVKRAALRIADEVKMPLDRELVRKEGGARVAS